MWSFAVGVYLIKLSPGSLRLTAIYGVVGCVTIILFAALVGHWIDNVSRLKAARWPLIIQNSLVTLSAVFVCLTLDDQWGFRSQHQVVFGFQVVIIILASAAQLASVASNISISKDWVVVIAAGDEDKLARLNTMCRRIDLVTKICAPLLVGQIMNLASDVVSAMVIAVWNIISMAIEYTLLFHIYKRVPALANPRGPSTSRNRKDLTDTNETEMETLASEASPNIDIDRERSRFIQPLNSYVSMWASYFKQDVMPAGIGLAFLYMTVLSFDNVTIGYAYNQGVAEWILGLLSGTGAVIGILGTLAFPVLLRKVGLIRTGLFGFGAEVACLSICVASIWVRGSPFDPSAAYGFNSPQILTEDNATIPTVLIFHSNTTNSTQFQHDSHSNREYLSVGLLLTGILLTRFGLWMADLSVNQLMQTEVDESERGVVNGVQSSLNTLMDLVKFGLVILLPGSETFGILILLSFGFICMG